MMGKTMTAVYGSYGYEILLNDLEPVYQQGNCEYDGSLIIPRESGIPLDELRRLAEMEAQELAVEYKAEYLGSDLEDDDALVESLVGLGLTDQRNGEDY